MDSPLTKTPALERALLRLRSRIRGLVFVHGIGTVLAVSSVWLVFAFLADWGLHVPRAVRLLHSAVVILLPAYFVWRELIRPLRKIPDRPGLALLLEREDPNLDELLVSATEFQLETGTPSGDPALIADVCREAETRVPSLSTRSILDPGAPALRMFAGLTCVAITMTLFIKIPEHAGIFFDRLLGRQVAWPQRTKLDIEFPGLADVTRTDEWIDVRLAHGSDVPVLIRALGIAPEEVSLRVGDGSEVFLPQGNSSIYRHVFPALTHNLEFSFVGGDDQAGSPVVRLTVLQPPDIEGIAVRTTPPAYTGLPERIEFNRDVEALVGSEVEVFMLPTPADATGVARLLPENRTLELVPTDYPLAPSETLDADGEVRTPKPGLRFRFEAERSVRFRFELTDDSGLTNPDPGLYAVSVIEDTPPTVQLHAPSRTDVETVAGGAIPLRVIANDDFGLVSLSWHVTESRDEANAHRGDLELEPLIGAEPTAPGTPVTAARANALFDISALAGPEGATNGSTYNLEVQATDNRQPEPGLGTSTSVRIRVVSTDELMRRVRDRLARVRTQANQLAELQTEKRQRVQELLEGLATDDLLEAGDRRELSSALNGQRLVRGDANSLTQELAAVVETILYAGLDDQAGPLLIALHTRMQAASNRSFQTEIWRTLVDDYNRGQLGAAGLAGNLTGILGVALAISEDHTPGASDALERAQDTTDASTLHAELETAQREQGQALARVEDLLERLSEWDSFQSVLLLTRDILERQSNLRQRTQRFATEK